MDYIRKVISSETRRKCGCFLRADPCEDCLIRLRMDRAQSDLVELTNRLRDLEEQLTRNAQTPAPGWSYDAIVDACEHGRFPIEEIQRAIARLTQTQEEQVAHRRPPSKNVALDIERLGFALKALKAQSAAGAAIILREKSNAATG